MTRPVAITTSHHRDDFGLVVNLAQPGDDKIVWGDR
jgi:hypothetical protein